MIGLRSALLSRISKPDERVEIEWEDLGDTENPGSNVFTTRFLIPGRTVMSRFHWDGIQDDPAELRMAHDADVLSEHDLDLHMVTFL